MFPMHIRNLGFAQFRLDVTNSPLFVEPEKNFVPVALIRKIPIAFVFQPENISEIIAWKKVKVKGQFETVFKSPSLTAEYIIRCPFLNTMAHSVEHQSL